MTTTQHPDQYDAIIIGSGQGGTPLASSLADKGWKTALIEREHVGGTCINEGCLPTKTMVASARVAYLARRAADYGVRAGPVSVDMARVRQRKRDIVAEWRDGKQSRLQTTEHLDLILGEARFAGPKTVAVALNGGGTRTLTAERIFINTGVRPMNPPIPGLDLVPTLNSTTIMELGELPEHLLVLGGGYVGIEFGQMFRRFGSRVTIVQREDQLLGREDPDVAEGVAQVLRDDGIDVLLNSEAIRAMPGAAGSPSAERIRLVVRTPNDERTLAGSHLLVAVGRRPNTDRLNLSTAGMNLAAAGVQTDHMGLILVNERLETNVPGVYALGDVKGGPAFTHISYDDYSIVYANLVEGGNRTTRDRLVPYTAFIDPQLGRVGLSEQQARAQGYDVRVAKINMEDVARANEVGETRGFIKAVVDGKTGQILGCAVLGIEGGEIMAMLEIAMLGKLPYTALRDAVFAHPTLAESLNTLFWYFEM